jgi:UDP-N-acetylglucosamine:LPS N-acetylglucosamine transferase
MLEDMFSNPQRLVAMAAAAGTLARPRAAEAMADAIEALAA